MGIIPGGASWGRKSCLKHWPTQEFARVADKLAQDYGAKIVIFSSEKERRDAEGVVNYMHLPAINLAGKTNLRQLMALIQRCNLLVANDGGALHIAVASGVKTVSLFGPVDERVYGPYPQSREHIVVKKDLSCRPCYRRFRVPECKYQRRCLTAISAEEVFREAERQIRSADALCNCQQGIGL